MNARPAVSIVITSYNYGRFIAQAIESVLNQSFRDVELLICDNASTDESADVIARYLGDERVRFVRHSENIGMLENHRFGLREARGRYIGFLSADDFYLPGHLQAAMDYYRSHPGVDVAWAGYVIANAAGDIVDGFYPPLHEGPNRNDFASLLVNDMYPCFPTMLFTRELIDEAGAFDPSFVAGDLEYVVRLAALGKRFACIGAAGVAWREHGTNVSGNRYPRSGDQIEDHLKLLEKYLVDENAPLVVGYGTGIARMLENKHLMLRRANAELAAQRETEIEARKAVLLERLRRYAILPVHRDAPEGPLVTVIVPTVGNTSCLASALRSVAAQTYARWEVVLVSDGGPDLSHVVAALPCAERITYVRRVHREGPAAARNTAYDFVHGSVVAYLDEDNRWDPVHLEAVVAGLAGGALAVRTEATLTVEVQDRTAPDGRRDLIRWSSVFAGANDAYDPYLAHAVPLNAVAHDFRCYQQIGGFDQSYAVLEDWEFLVRLQAAFGLHAVAAPTVDVRVRPGLAQQHFATCFGAFAPSIERLYNAHLASPSGTTAEARMAHFRAASDAASHVFAAPGDAGRVETFFRALAGARKTVAVV
ncbi:MAG: hypothetical protein QOJ39_84 [Candidatus Eremiobacteraeota bacterium]|jgi:glycosyltransferase involved in cell wall biosynthesis|nr:hypothetical protein [Candidatus Eremiobacteraeota bacterium]